jgi:hypothetical protein
MASAASFSSIFQGDKKLVHSDQKKSEYTDFKKWWDITKKEPLASFEASKAVTLGYFSFWSLWEETLMVHLKVLRIAPMRINKLYSFLSIHHGML